ncbi:glycoside hydrolase family 16 protein [Flavihumibacter petaseus]|nr:glycoside hydrolase family 16 protein [Flavihumibacter petaseus]
MRKISALNILFTLCFLACQTASIHKSSQPPFTRLIWSDEFHHADLDSGKWTRITANTADWGKHMTTDPACFGWENDCLVLKGINNPDTTTDKRPFLTGGIYTKDKFSFTYGRVEIRAKFKSAQGAWPAFWMLGANTIHGGYPKNGEIDIMEHLNYDDSIYQTIHSWYTLELKQKTNPQHFGKAAIQQDAFNTYALERTPDYLSFSVNGKETFRYPRRIDVDSSQWPFDQPFYLLIDQQLGGSWVGSVNPSSLPAYIYLDWVRIYQ